MRMRMYEHKVVSHKASKVSHSVNLNQTTAQPQSQPETQGLRRSARLRAQDPVNYSRMHTGAGQPTSEGATPLSQHMAAADHHAGDVKIEVVASEQSRWRRQLKEALAIQRINPTLNEDDGAYKLSKIYTTLPKFGNRSNLQTVKAQIMQQQNLPQMEQ